MWEYNPVDFWGPLFPQETNVTLLLNTVTQLCAEDSRRVYLALHPTGGQGVNVSTKSNVNSGIGKLINNSGAGSMILTFPDAGPLVGMAWFGFAAAGTTVCVMELLREYDPAARQKTNQRGEEDEASGTQEDTDRGNGYGTVAPESPPYRAHFLGALGRRLRDQLHGPGLSWQWDQDSGGYYPVNPDPGNDR